MWIAEASPHKVCEGALLTGSSLMHMAPLTNKAHSFCKLSSCSTITLTFLDMLTSELLFDFVEEWWSIFISDQCAIHFLARLDQG